MNNNLLITALLSFCSTVAALLQLHIILILHLMRQQQEHEQRYQELMHESISIIRNNYHMRRRDIRKRRRNWINPGRTDQWWQNLCGDQMPDQEWKKNLRMSKEDFFVFLEPLRTALSPNENAVRNDCLTPEKKLAMVLYYLKDQGHFSMTANTFGVTVPTMSKVP